MLLEQQGLLDDIKPELAEQTQLNISANGTSTQLVLSSLGSIQQQSTDAAITLAKVVSTLDRLVRMTP